MAKAIREHLINVLANGEFVSGQLLGDQLNISRTSISKHINALIGMGLDIYSVTGKGYRLAKPLNLLSKNILKVNKKKYENYKSIYMINNKNKKNNPNYQIIRNLINKL